MSSYRSPRLFKLKPQSKARGRDQLLMGSLLVLFALFNLYLASTDGFISLLFAVIFGWSGLRSISTGARLLGLPEHDRAYRVSTRGLYKVMNGKDLARLDLAQVKATWLNQRADQLSLMTQRGVEVIKRDELVNPQEWESFTTWLERSITEVIYRGHRDRWESLQRQSLIMSELEQRKARGVRLMMIALVVGAVIFFYQMNDHLLFFMQTNGSDLIYELLGAPSGVSLTAGEVTRLFGGLVLPESGVSLLFNLATLYWVGRHLERVWGTMRVVLLFVGGYLATVFAIGALAPQEFARDALGGSVALLVATLMFRQTIRAQPNPVIRRAYSNTTTMIFVFIFVIALDPSLGAVEWGAWLCSGVLGGWAARQWMRMGASNLWVLPQLSKQALWSAVLSASLPIASVVFMYTQPPPLARITSAQELTARLSPLSIAELAQRCSGAPLQLIAELPPEVSELIKSPTRCSPKEQALLSDALMQLEGEYPPIKPKLHSPLTSASARSASKNILKTEEVESQPEVNLKAELKTQPEAQLEAQPKAEPKTQSDRRSGQPAKAMPARASQSSSPELRIALDRARWLNRVAQLSDTTSLGLRQSSWVDLIQELIPLALSQPRELSGDLLVSLIRASVSPELSAQAKPEVTISTRAGRLRLKIDQGSLTWRKLDDVSIEKGEGQDELARSPVRRWFLIFDEKNEVSSLISIAVNQGADLKQALRSGERLGDGQYSMVEVPRELTSPSSDQTLPRGAYLKFLRWSHHPKFTRWVTGG